MQWMWLFLPDEALVLVIALIGLGLMAGLLRPRSAGQLLGGIVLMLLLTPFAESLVAWLPGWVTLVLLAGIALAVIRGFFRLVLGSRAADNMVGSLAADVVRTAFRGVFFLFTLLLRFIGWMSWRI